MLLATDAGKLRRWRMRLSWDTFAMIRNHSPEPADAPVQRLLPACLAVFMSGFVAAVVTAINTGIDAAYPWRWLLAWAIACPAAIVAAYLFRPLAWRLAAMLSRMR